MPQPSKGPRLGGSPAHERLMLANLATSLFRHGKIKTTETKARRLRPYAERIVTFAKRGDLASRRRTMSLLRDGEVVHNLFAEIAPRYATRPGGYTRIVKVGPRKGDNAPMAVIELVEELVIATTERGRGAKKAARKAAKSDTIAALAGEDDEQPTAKAKAAEEADEATPADDKPEAEADEKS